MESMKKLGMILLAVALMISVLGCASSQTPDNTTISADTTAPNVTVEYQEVTDPGVDVTIALPPVTVKPGISTGVSAATEQIRIHTTGDGWQNAFNQENGCLAVASSVAELQSLLQEKLSGFSLDLSGYDDAFFAENRLVLIPRSSNSGSVVYEAELNPDGDFVHVELDASMPEGAGTADMAQWLVLVTLPNSEYGDLTVSAPVAAGTTGTVTK